MLKLVTFVTTTTLLCEMSLKRTSYSPKCYFSLVGQVTVTWHSSDRWADNNCTNELWTNRHLVSDKCWCHVTCPKEEFSNFTATSVCQDHKWIPSSKCITWSHLYEQLTLNVRRPSYLGLTTLCVLNNVCVKMFSSLSCFIYRAFFCVCVYFLVLPR